MFSPAIASCLLVLRLIGSDSCAHARAGFPHQRKLRALGRGAQDLGGRRQQVPQPRAPGVQPSLVTSFLLCCLSHGRVRLPTRVSCKPVAMYCCAHAGLSM